jgi:hypothetical protein
MWATKEAVLMMDPPPAARWIGGSKKYRKLKKNDDSAERQIIRKTKIKNFFFLLTMAGIACRHPYHTPLTLTSKVWSQTLSVVDSAQPSSMCMIPAIQKKKSELLVS